MFRLLVISALLLTLIVPLPAAAQDDLKPLVEKGRKAIDSKDYQAALDHFQQVVQKLQEIVGAAFEHLMPEAPTGWDAGELTRYSWAGTSEEFSGNMINISQKFTRKSDGKVCRINIVNWPQQMAALKQALATYKQMGDMLNANSNVQFSIEETGGWTVMRMVNQDSRATEIRALSEHVMVSIELDDPDAKAGEMFLNLMNLADIEKRTKRGTIE